MGYTQVSASNITDLNGNKLASGTILFLATDQNDQPISFQVAGGGQALRRAISATVTNGAIAAGLQVPDPAMTSPSGILYRIWVRDTTTGNVVLDYRKVSFQGSAFNLDNYLPSATVVPPPTTGIVTGPLNVNGDLSTTGAVSGTGGTLNPQRINQVRIANRFAGADISAQIAAAIADIGPAGGAGGTVEIEPGSYTFSTSIELQSNIRIVGQGRRSVILNYTGTGAAISTAGTGLQLAAIENVRISLGSSATAVGISLSAGSQAGQDVRWNTFRDLEFAGGNGVVAGQVGVVTNVPNSTVAIVSENEWDRLSFFEVDTAIQRSGEEGNVWRDIQITSCGNKPQFVESGIHDCYTQGRVAGTVTSAVSGSPDDCHYVLVCDIGPVPALNIGAGYGNVFILSLVGTTTLGNLPTPASGDARGNFAWTSKDGFCVFPAPNGAAFTCFLANSSYLLRNLLAYGDANPNFSISQLGTINWGPGGVGSTDISLFRTAAGVLQLNGSFQIGTNQVYPTLSGGAVTLGGSAMTAGQRITGTTTVTGATVGMAVAVSPQADPGAGFIWHAWVSAANTVTVALTCIAAGTPTATTYNVRVIQ